MNLIKFLLLIAILSLVLGELGKFPFGAASANIGVTDILTSLAVVFFLIWKIGIKKKLLVPVAFRLIVLFWVTGLVSLFIATDFSGFMYLVRFVIYSSVFLITYTLIKEKILKQKTISDIFSVTALIIMAAGLIQLVIFPDLSFMTDFGYDPHIGRLTAAFLDPNFAGGILNLLLVITMLNIAHFRRSVFMVMFFLMTVSVFLTFSRSSYIQLIFQLFVISAFRYRKLLVLIVIIPLILYFTVPRFAQRISGGFSLDVTASERLLSWKKGWDIFLLNPVTGVGFNNLRSVSVKQNMIKTYSQDGGHSGAGIDSSLLTVLATTGMVGIIVYLSFFGFLIRIFAGLWLKNKNIAGFISLVSLGGIFIHSLFVNSLFYPPVMLVMYSYLGLIYAKSDENI